jgi:thiosulfate dehydrogenase [quinone] large subunit
MAAVASRPAPTEGRLDTPVVTPAGPAETSAPAGSSKAPYVWALTRLSLGWVFLWAFLDKTFGLGFATESADAWIEGGSPTFGFLSLGTSGPFAETFQSIAGAAWADWTFMIGLLGIGLALMLGVGMRIAAAGGAALLVLMWMAALPVNNPFMDDHIIYALVLVGLALAGAGRTWGFGKAWERLAVVQRFGILK